MNRCMQWLVVCTVLIAETKATHAESADSVLTLSTALALVLEKSPELAVYPAEIRAAEARVLQAGLQLNPEMTATFEDFAGTDEFGGTRQLQTTVQLGQVIELGGKRSARRNVAQSELDVAGRDYELRRVEVLADATGRFIDVVGAQDQLALARQAKTASEELSRNAADRLKAGNGTPLEEKRVAVALLQSRVDEERAMRELDSARRRLAAAWGSDTLEFARAGGDLFALRTLAPFEELAARLTSGPEIARWASEQRLREAELRLAKSGATPDLTVAGGIRRHASTDDYSFVAELAFPLPLFNRSQGSKRAAVAQMERTQLAQTAAEVRLRSLLFDGYQKLVQTSVEVRTGRDEVLPMAQEALELAQEGYQAGRFSYLEVSEAQRAVFELNARLISAAQSYHKLLAEIERVTGQTLQP